MKKLLIALLLVSVVAVLLGCAQKDDQGQTADTPDDTLTDSGTAGNPAVSAAEISGDIESVLREVTSIDVNDTGDALTPLTDEDLNLE